MKYKIKLLLLSFLPIVSLSRDITIEKNLYWTKFHEVVVEGQAEIEKIHCQGCLTSGLSAEIPLFSEVFKLNSNEYISSVDFTSLSSEPINDYIFPQQQKSYISSTPEIKYSEAIERKTWRGIIEFIPLVNKNGRIEKVKHFTIRVRTGFRPVSTNKAPATTFKTSSVLNTGEWYKIAVNHDAVYKISYRFLEQQGIDVKNLDPGTISIFGNGGGMLPRKNSSFRYDDLEENAIVVQGESDGSFDKNDYILFYGEGPNKWQYIQGKQRFQHYTHKYSDTNFYFIRINGPTGKRVASVNVTGSPAATVTTFDHFEYHESNKINLLKSGDDWLGEVFDLQTSYNFPFNFPNIVPGSQAHARIQVVTASTVESNWNVTIQGTSGQFPGGVASGGYGQVFAKEVSREFDFTTSGSIITVELEYQKPSSSSSSKGWLDWIEINARRRLIINGNQLKFRDLNSVGNQFIRFEVSAAKQGTKIWEVTDHINPKIHSTNFSGGKIDFINEANSLKTYIAVNSYDSSCTWMGNVGNQNLHAESGYDYVIISHPLFLQAANRIKMIHEARGLDVVIATPQKIYNEFSSGKQDIVALRDFVRMLYQRATTPDDAPKYLLMLGDGSYDPKNRIGGNTNFVPTFESDTSYHPAQSYVSDDFYCMLDSNEGTWTKHELMDVGIGRIPAQTLDQANKVVDKIERYLSVKSHGDWRNLLCFVADDEDSNVHMGQSNGFANQAQTKDTAYNIEKIFIDAYKQHATPGGERYPDAREALKRQVQRGALIVTYSGHGGEVGWAHERILTMNEINNWSNNYNLPVFLTATCEFSRWDDPQRVAAGEVVLMNPVGGGVGLLTTVRLVYSGDGGAIASTFYKYVFDKVNGEYQTLGEIYRRVKNEVSISPGFRNFNFLGDPALSINYPKFNVMTDSINGLPVTSIDTVSALGLVTVKGHLTDLSGNKMTNFNGILYPTVYDKSQDIETQNNDGHGVFKFNLRNKKLFRGKASVTNGEFSFQFIVPKDIAYNYGRGKMSYYADNQQVDANGHSFDFIVGGTDPNAAEDNQGPDVEIYLNDETFVYGGITDENPILIAKIYDQHGINMAGTGIGHDISAILDGKTDNPIVLNDYYSAEIDNYQAGSVTYPFEGLEPGPHTLTLKVWDVYNNSSEATIEFIVQEYQDIALNRVLNYPNPFTTNTSFWFEHNQPSTVLDVKIQIFTISGKVVKTIEKIVENEGFSQNLNNPISWNGRDEYGDKLGRGVYIYKLQVRSRRNGTMAEKLEKLVIL